MTNFEYLTQNKEALARFLDKYCCSDNNPMINWFNDKYCNNCEAEYAYVDYLNDEAYCSYCELNNTCKFFKDEPDIPSSKTIIKMWLNLEYKGDFNNE